MYKKYSYFPDHPSTIVISRDELLAGTRPITELDIWNYYLGVKYKMLPEFKGRDLFIGLKLKESDNPQKKKVMIIRHPYDKKTEYIRINSEKDFEIYHSGRTVEFHCTTPAMTPYFIVDFDATSFDQAKRVAADIYDKIIKHPNVKSADTRYSGKRGFHTLAWLKKDQPIDNAREDLKEWLKTEFEGHEDVILGESPKGNKGALGVAPMKLHGGQIALWSLRPTGLCCIEVPRAQLGGFKQSDATIDKAYKKATGKDFPWGKEKDKKMAHRVAALFLERQLCPI